MEREISGCCFERKIDDAAMADDIFSTLMGEKVQPRREFIELHAHEVFNTEELDV